MQYCDSCCLLLFLLAYFSGEASGSTLSPPLLQQHSVAESLSPTKAYHDPPSPTVPYHDKPSPTIRYHDQPSPTVPYHDLPSPTVSYNGPPSPTVPYQQAPSPTVPYHDSPTDSDKLDVKEDSEQLHTQTKDIEPTVPYQREEEEKQNELLDQDHPFEKREISPDQNLGMATVMLSRMEKEGVCCLLVETYGVV